MVGKGIPSGKSKVTKKSSPKFVNPGGSGRMHTKGSAGPQPSDRSSQEGSGGGNFASGGGSGKMHKKSGSSEAKPA